eukprot:4652573-Prymnesium_polylepis.1
MPSESSISARNSGTEPALRVPLRIDGNCGGSVVSVYTELESAVGKLTRSVAPCRWSSAIFGCVETYVSTLPHVAVNPAKLLVAPVLQQPVIAVRHAALGLHGVVQQAARAVRIGQAQPVPPEGA